MSLPLGKHREQSGTASVTPYSWPSGHPSSSAPWTGHRSGCADDRVQMQSETNNQLMFWSVLNPCTWTISAKYFSHVSNAFQQSLTKKCISTMSAVYISHDMATIYFSYIFLPCQQHFNQYILSVSMYFSRVNSILQQSRLNHSCRIGTILNVLQPL